MDNIYSSLTEQARETALREVDQRLAEFCEGPWRMDAIDPRLRSLEPADALELLDEIQEKVTSNVHILRGGFVPLINIEAARQLFTHLRRDEEFHAAARKILIRRAKELLAKIPAAGDPAVLNFAEALSEFESLYKEALNETSHKD